MRKRQKRSPGGICNFQRITLACVLQLHQGCTRELFFVRPFHLDHFVFRTREARLCAPRISSTESDTEQQWHANPRALNGLTCGPDNSRGEARRHQRGREPVSPETGKRTAAELIWITFLAEILKRAFRQSSTPSRTVNTRLLRTRSRVPQRLRLHQTAPSRSPCRNSSRLSLRVSRNCF